MRQAFAPRQTPGVSCHARPLARTGHSLAEAAIACVGLIWMLASFKIGQPERFWLKESTCRRRRCSAFRIGLQRQLVSGVRLASMWDG